MDSLLETLAETLLPERSALLLGEARDLLAKGRRNEARLLANRASFLALDDYKAGRIDRATARATIDGATTTALAALGK